jgi:predicted GTPase
VDIVRRNIREHAPQAEIVLAESPVLVSRPDTIRGLRVLVVEDGPTLTHGGMPHGAGYLAAQTCGARDVVDPRPYAVGTLREAYARYPQVGPVLPAMGYGQEQIRDLEETINRVPCDRVLFATPIHLPRILSVRTPTLRVRYEYRDHGEPHLEDALLRRLAGRLDRGAPPPSR